MPLYGVRQSGGNVDASKNLTSVVPGDGFTLFDGTETIAAGTASVAFSRGYSAGVSDNGITFKAVAIPTDCTVDIQTSNQDVDAYYTTQSTLSAASPDYTDVGRAAFYRAKVNAYTSGSGLILTAQR